MSNRSLVAAFLSASLAFAPRAFADTSPQDRAAADGLYEEAGKLAHQQRWHEAAAKLQASFKLDPAIGTLMQLAYVYEKEGRTASAWSTYQDAQALADKTGDKRAKQAAQEARRLEPTLPRMLLDVPPESRAGGIEIKRDGTTISADAWGSAVPVDPGTHELEANGPGKLPWKTTVTIEAKPGTTTMPVPVLQNGPTASTAPAPFWGTQRIAGVAVAGVGVAGVIAGAIAGGVSIAKKNALAGECKVGTPYMCTPAGIDLHSQAVTTANVANGALAVGAAALVTGAVVFFTAPKSGGGSTTTALGVSPLVARDVGGIALTGRW